MSGAVQIVGIRTASFAGPDLDDALWNQRTLVKTWGMRGTLHLFPSAELPLWVAAFTRRQWPRFTPAWEKSHGVKPDDLRAITAAVGEVLPGRVLARDELATESRLRLRKPALAEKIRSGLGRHAQAGRRWRPTLLRPGSRSQRHVHRSAQPSADRVVGRRRSGPRSAVRSWPGSSIPTGPRPTRTSAGGGGLMQRPLGAFSPLIRTPWRPSWLKARRPG